MRSIVYVSLFVARWYAVIGAFRSSLLFRSLLGPHKSAVVGIYASGISIPLFLLAYIYTLPTRGNYAVSYWRKILRTDIIDWTKLRR